MADALGASLLITGASGQLGRRAVDLLLTAGADRLVAATRTPDKLADLAARGAEIRLADFDNPSTLAAAFAGVDRVLIVSTDALGIPGQRARQHKAAVEAAVQAGVKHIVYTSMPNPGPGSLIPFGPDHNESERLIEQSGVGFTILRNNWYHDSIFLWLPQALKTGQWFTAAGNGRVGYVSREDCARAAAAALSSGKQERKRYDITGPQALRTTEIAAAARDVFGKPIEVVNVTDEQLKQGLAAAGLPGPLVELVVAMDANTRLGKVDVATDAVKQITKQKPQSLRDFMIANKAAILGAAGQ